MLKSRPYISVPLLGGRVSRASRLGRPVDRVDFVDCVDPVT